jgi:hypothetical protein
VMHQGSVNAQSSQQPCELSGLYLRTALLRWEVEWALGMRVRVPLSRSTSSRECLGTYKDMEDT